MPKKKEEEVKEQVDLIDELLGEDTTSTLEEETPVEESSEEENAQPKEETATEAETQTEESSEEDSEPAESTEPEEEATSEEPAKPEESAEKEPTEEEADPTTLLKQINELAAENLRLQKQQTVTGTEKQPQTEPKVKEPEAVKPVPLQTLPDGKLFKDQEEYVEALNNFDTMNNQLARFRSSVFEEVAVKLIPVVGNMIRDYFEQGLELRDFYKEKTDLADLKDMVELEMTKIRSKKPELKTRQLLEEAAKNVEKQVGMFIKKKRSSNRVNGKPKPRFATPTSGKRPAPVKRSPNSQQSLIDSMDFE